MRVGFIGLGNIGAPMARRLLRPEFELTVHDNHAAALQPFEGTPARVTRSCVELARSSEVIAVCVRDDVRQGARQHSFRRVERTQIGRRVAGARAART